MLYSDRPHDIWDDKPALSAPDTPLKVLLDSVHSASMEHDFPFRDMSRLTLQDNLPRFERQEYQAKASRALPTKQAFLDMLQRLRDEENAVPTPMTPYARSPAEPPAHGLARPAPGYTCTRKKISAASTPDSQSVDASPLLDPKTHLQRIIVLVTLSAGLLLLIGPLWLLHQLSTEQAKLTTISMLVAVFVCLLGIGTGAGPAETLAAAAA